MRHPSKENGAPTVYLVHNGTADSHELRWSSVFWYPDDSVAAWMYQDIVPIEKE